MVSAGIVWMVLLAGPLLFIIPGMDVGSQENTVDTMLMLWNSPGLTVGTIIYWFTVLGTNMCGVLVRLSFMQPDAPRARVLLSPS